VISCLVSALLASSASAARADALADALEPHVGQTIDLVELGTGKRFVRPTLDGVTQRGDKATALRLTPEGATKTVSVPLAGIAKIIAGRETIHESAGKGNSAVQLRGRKARENREQEMLAAVERMEKNGVSPRGRIAEGQQGRCQATDHPGSHASCSRRKAVLEMSIRNSRCETK